MVLRAGAVLNEKLGLGQLPASQAIKVLPRSLEAQRLYAEGLQKLQLMEATAAKDLLEEAAQAEPSYALGHSALADAWSTLGYEARAREEAKLALNLSASLSPEEALSVEAKYRGLAGKNSSRTLQVFAE